MALDIKGIKSQIENAIPGSSVRVENLRNDGQNHFVIHVTSSAFSGKTRVQQHQMVHRVIKDHLDLESVPVALQTVEK